MLKVRHLKISRKVLIFGGLILLLEFIIFSFVSYPPNMLYLMRKGGQSLIVTTKSAPQRKADVYLAESVRLYQHLSQIQQKNPQDPSLGLISQELTYQEQNAIKQMDIAKKAGIDIKKQVTLLCDTLLKQYATLQQSLPNAHTDAKPQIQESLNIIQKHIAESIGW